MNRSMTIVLFAFAVAACTSGPAPQQKAEPMKTQKTTSTPGPHQVLLEEWTGPHGGVPPWDLVDHKLFEPAMEQAANMLLEEVDAIANSEAPPDFENTLGALERAGKALDRSATLFFVMSANMNQPEIQKLTGIIRPRLAKVSDQINFNEKLFARVKTIYETRDSGALNPEQIRLTEKSYQDFVRRGANLGPEKKKRMGEINQRLAKLFTDFGNRVLADEDTWVVLQKKDLGGLPEALVSTYRAAAEKRKVEGYAVVNTRSAVDPFLTFSSNRKLREKVWRAFVKRGDNGDKNDTNKLITEIVKLRAERAKLLGFESHAHWRMSDTMAKDPKRAQELMERVWPAAVARVKQEVKDMSKLARKEGAKIKIEPWDYRYYMEKVRKKRYALDQNEFKNYFELNNMIEASYYMADRLYGYAFEEITGAGPRFSSRRPGLSGHEQVRRQSCWIPLSG